MGFHNTINCKIIYYTFSFVDYFKSNHNFITIFLKNRLIYLKYLSIHSYSIYFYLNMKSKLENHSKKDSNIRLKNSAIPL